LTGGPDFYFPEPEFYAVLPLFVEIFSSFAKYLQTEAARIASEAGQLSSAPEIVDPRLKNKVSSRAEPENNFYRSRGATRRQFSPDIRQRRRSIGRRTEARPSGEVVVNVPAEGRT
jgi:hypothetical protein